VQHSLFLAALGFGLVLAPAAGLAVINTDNPTSSTPDNQTAPNGVAGWYNVGQVINPGLDSTELAKVRPVRAI
jgi:hypothetical protein